MAGVTDLPFRKLCMVHGAGAAVSEMIAADPSLWQTKKSQKRLDHCDEAGLRWIQIAGSEAHQLAHAAKHNANLGADIIDINMGCPAKKVCNKAAGSALLANPAKVREILHRVVDAVQIPVTLKIRTGSDPDSRNALEIAAIAEEAGIQALSIHGRTRAEKFTGNAEYQTIAAVKKAVAIPVIANGDIKTGLNAKTILDFTAADGIMIGRAAQGRPWIFSEINYYLNTGKSLALPSLEKIIDTLRVHVQHLHQFYGLYMGVKIARKHVGWYLNNLQAGKEFRKVFNQIEEPMLQLKWIQQLTQQLSSITEIVTTETPQPYNFYLSTELAKVS
jgi:tRNA-dihydrouridine synthase B